MSRQILIGSQTNLILFTVQNMVTSQVSTALQVSDNWMLVILAGLSSSVPLSLVDWLL